jgi:hypothetical protein
MTKSFLRWLLLLLFVSFAMAVVQWLAAPEGYGASAWAHALPELGYPKLGAMLRSLSSVEAVGIISTAWERVINAPRNELLHDLGYLSQHDSTYFYATPHRPFSDDWRGVLMFAFGTAVVFLPLIIGIVFVRVSGWNVMKKPVLIAIAVFVAATGIFAVVSNAESSSKSATIFTALSLLTAAVGIVWTPLLTRPRRVTATVVLLVIVSAVGMVAITRSTGPSDTLSYPIFVGWTFAVLLVEGGAFLLLVGGINGVMSRGRHEPPPSGTMELRTGK